MNPTRKKLLKPRIPPAKLRVPTSAALADIDHALRSIAANAQTDPEAAHGLRDALYVLVLRFVAAGHPHSEALAHRALRATRIKLLWDATA